MIRKTILFGLATAATYALANPEPTPTPPDPSPHSVAHSAPGKTSPLDPALRGILKDMPLHVMEFHIWWETPWNQGPPTNAPRWGKWLWSGDVQDADRAVGPAWRRRLSSLAYPLIGPYHSADREVIRWQLRCVKAAGFDAVHIMNFPSHPDGQTFSREAIFKTVLDIAGEENVPIIFYDEVQHSSARAGTREVMSQRATDILTRHGTHPAWYRLDGKPVYSFQYWKRFMPPDDLRQMMRDVNEAVPGGVHFLVNGGVTPELRAIPEIGSLVATSSGNLNRSWRNRTPEWDWGQTGERLAAVRKNRNDGGPQKPAGLWLYPGIDTSAQRTGRGKWLSRGDNQATLQKVLLRYMAEKPDFLILSSWNDWNENNAIEPSLEVDGRGNDPYETLRLIAHLNGKDFLPPPLPPLDHIDPWMRACHGGEDNTPPWLTSLWLAPNAGEIRATLVDETSPVDRLEINRAPIARASWENGKITASKSTLRTRNQPAAMTGIGTDEGVTFEGVKLDLPLEFVLTTEAQTDINNADAEVWLALVYFDSGYGTIRINYPRTPALTTPPQLCLPIPLGDTRRWRSATRRLDGFTPNSPKPVILSWPTRKAPDGQGNPDGPPVTDGSPMIAGVSLFKDSGFTIKDTYLSGADKERNTGTWRIRHIPWEAGNPSIFLIRAVDKHGNISNPLPITPALHGTVLFRPYVDL
jgi:hypothetical protein